MGADERDVTVQTKGALQVFPGNLDSLVKQVNDQLRRVRLELDTLAGLRGAVTVPADLRQEGNVTITGDLRVQGNVTSEAEEAAASEETEAEETIVVVATNQTLTQSSTTLQNIIELVFPMKAGRVYEIEVSLLLNAANATSDWKFGWSAPTNCTMFWGPHQVAGGTTVYWNYAGTGVSPDALLGVADTLSIGSANNTHGLYLRGKVRNPSYDGNLQLQAAQDTANASDNKILTDSAMLVRLLRNT